MDSSFIRGELSCYRSKKSVLKSIVHYYKQPVSLRIGGIFLANKQITPASCPARFFTAKQAPSLLLDLSRRANKKFLDTHETYAKHHLVGIQHFIIYLNGHLHLWKPIAHGEYQEIEKTETPALMESYIVHKTLIHKITELLILWNALEHHHASIAIVKAELLRMTEDLENLSTQLGPDHSAQHLKTIDFLINTIMRATDCKTLEELAHIQCEFSRKMFPIITTYGQECTRLQLEGLHTIMKRWTAEHSILADTSRVIIVGTRGPRKDMIEKQFFEDHYKKAGTSPKTIADRVLYEERAGHLIPDTDITKLIEDFGKYLLNQTVGLKGLGNKDAMNEDVLGIYAPKVL